MGALQSGFRLAVATGVLFLTTACYRPAFDPRPQGSWTYSVEAPPRGSRVVRVEATFDRARTERITLARETAPFVRDMQVRNGDGYRNVELRGGEWFERSCVSRCTIRYSVDLGSVAAGCGDEIDCARRVGETTLSPALQWLAHPTPRSDVPVSVRVNVPDGAEFATGMQRADAAGRRFAFRSFDLDEGSFTAFGPLRKQRVDVAGADGRTARVDVALLGRFGMPDAAFGSWVGDAAGVTVPLFGRFPVDQATVFVVPVRGEDQVVFGKVLSLAGASVVVLVGDEMPAAAQRKDWVLVHELFHLGFPTFRGEGRWLGEGLATYYEPILRARAGWLSEAEVFRQFARNMPRGQPARGASAGIAQRSDLDTIYWGGALFCLAADVRIREETRGRKSLDDVLRSGLARGGDATRVWSLRDVVRVGDEATGTNVLADMYDRYAARGERIDLDGLLRALGVDVDPRAGGATISEEERPLAWVRRRIVDRPDRFAVAESR